MGCVVKLNSKYIKKKFTNVFSGDSTYGKKNSCPLPEGYVFHSISFNQNNALIVPYGRYMNNEVVTNCIFATGVTSANTTVETTVIFERL